MSRAAILPFPGDPFLINYWLNLYDTVWGSEIDKLYIYLNSTIEKPAVDYIRDRVAKSKNINFTYNDLQIEHGDAIDRALDLVTEDLVMLIEDDAFIFKPGIVDKAFKMIESGEKDIVGSKRGSCSFEILRAAEEKWGIGSAGAGDQGCNFWPCYFFTKTDILKKTSRRFGARSWLKGDTIEPLALVVEAPQVVGDTFVNTSLELRAMIPEDRIAYLPQYHASPDDLDHFNKQIYLFDGKAPWTHIGSLSSGVGGVLRDEHNRALTRRLIDPEKGPTKLEPWANTDGEKREWERRVTWWATFYEKATNINEDIVELYDLYGQAVQRIIEQYKLKIGNIHALQKAYSTIGL